MKIYIDHNVLDALSKNHFQIKPPEGTVWIYSNETFNEIKRSGDLRFLDVLRELKARKVELVLDAAFRLTEQAYIFGYRDPKEMYQIWLDAIEQCPLDEQLNLQFLSRLAGDSNHNEVLSFPDKLNEQIRNLLSPYGLLPVEFESKLETATSEIQKIVEGPMQEIQELEHSRSLMGTGRGRAGNTRDDNNPIEALWDLVKDKCKGMTIDQFFGFDPIDKQGYDTWPLYLGIAGCHTVLNFLGFNADRGLNRADKLPGILSDGRHIAMGIYCDAILSKDQKFCAKARAIYTYLGLDVQVLEIKY